MKTLLLLFNIMALASCVPSKEIEGEASSGNINASAPYMWPSNAFPRDVLISDSFTNDELNNITGMTTAWETGLQNKRNFFSHSGRTTEVSSSTLDLDSLGDDGISGVYKITHWPSSLPGSALAVTQIFGRRFNIGSSSEYVRIEHADILVNDHYYNFRTADGGGAATFDLQTVMLHELGHYIGLQHKTGNTVMVSSIGYDSVIRAPTNIDIGDVASKYGISLGTGSGSMVAAETKTYVPASGDAGQKIKILIELHASGECVHREDGIVVKRH